MTQREPQFRDSHQFCEHNFTIMALSFLGFSSARYPWRLIPLEITDLLAVIWYIACVFLTVSRVHRHSGQPLSYAP